MYHQPGININLGGSHGIHGHHGHYGRHGGNQMMVMMRMMLQIMARMMGGGHGHGGCSCHHRPHFGQGMPFNQGPSININLGHNIRGFLG